MKETNDFLMPEYYLHFSCKMGDCRAACCEGWPISVSMENYFRLLGVGCSKSLRDRLDVGLRMVDRPTPECYARFNPRYDGNCPLRMEDGRCAVHAELGEDALPDICRLYPRGIRLDQDRECSCANSCEAVLELLGKEKEPMRFVRQKMCVNVPDSGHHTSMFDTLGRRQKMRMLFIRILQNRQIPLRARLRHLYSVIADISAALEQKDGDAVDAIAARAENIEERFVEAVNPGEDSVLRGLDLVGRMLELFDERHDSIRDFGEAARMYYGEEKNRFQRYNDAREHFDTLFPDWEIWFEQILVNHIFFSQFPFQERPVSLPDECSALFAVYAILRYIGLGYMADRTEEQDFVDAASAAFRMIDHTEFEPYAAVLLRNFGIDTDEKRADLLVL